MSKKWCENSGRATCSPYASDNAACTQRPDRAPVESTIPKVSITLRKEYKAGHNECGSTTRAPKLKRKRIIKIVGASTLAIMMGASVLCGVLILPMNSAQANTSGATSAANGANLSVSSQSGGATSNAVVNTQQEGLITPSEDDPVLFTTESGLEIKFANASYLNSLASGNLAGLPYLKTYDATTSTYYTWVIIGQSFTQTVSEKASAEIVGDEELAKEVVQTMLTTGNNPAGLAILSEYLGYATYSSEIPSGSVLCIANDIITSCAYNVSVYNDGYSYGNRRMYHSTYVGTLSDTLEGYYNDKSLGLSSLIDSGKILSVELQSGGMYNTGFTGNNGSGIVYYEYREVEYTRHIFTLSGNGNFLYSTYFKKYSPVCSSTWWLRSSYEQSVGNAGYETIGGLRATHFLPYCHAIDSEGELITGRANTEYGARPCFVLKVV